MKPHDENSALIHLAAALGISANSEGLKALAQNASLSACPAGTRLFSTGDVCQNFVVVLRGTAKVQLSTRTGREMILFRLQPGQSCALTTSCILTQSPYYAEGLAETDLEILTLPSQSFLKSVQTQPELFTKILNNYAERIGELTSVIDRLMTRDLATELKSFLIAKADDQNRVILSHQMIADELASSREVISRKLKSFEKAGLIEMSRGQVKLIKLK